MNFLENSVYFNSYERALLVFNFNKKIWFDYFENNSNIETFNNF